MDVARERMGGTPIPGRPAADQAGRADGASASGHGAGADWQMEELADGAGFEPAIRFPVYTLSKRAP